MPDVTGPIRTFGQGDDFATGDGNYTALGLHVKNNISGMLAITAKRRKGVFTAAGANANPEPVACLVKDKGDGKSQLYYLKTEPGTEFTTLANWEVYNPVSIAGGVEYKGQFTPASATLVNGTGTNGFFYIADADGSFNGDAYVSGDWSIYDGSVWRKIPAGISALPPAAHTHPISEVTGLVDALSNKVSTSDVATSVTSNSKVPTNQAIIDYAYSKGEVDALATPPTTDASELTSGTLADDRLSSKIPRLDENATFTDGINSRTATISNGAFSAKVIGNLYDRFNIRGDGRLTWTNGSTPDFTELKLVSTNLELNTKLNSIAGLQENGVDLEDKYAPKDTSEFVAVTENQFGTHPAFATLMQFVEYVLSGAITPPTSGTYTSTYTA